MRYFLERSYRASVANRKQTEHTKYSFIKEVDKFSLYMTVHFLPVFGIRDILVRIRMWILFEGTFTSFFKDKSHKKAQNSRNKGFPSFFACQWKDLDSDPVRKNKLRIRMRTQEVQKDTDSGYGSSATNLDLQLVRSVF